METPQRYSSRLTGLALGVLLALWIWPATRWLVCSQFAFALPAHSTLTPSCPAGFASAESIGSLRKATHQTAKQHPDNYLFQLAAAVTPDTSNQPLTASMKLDRLRALEPRFPDRPSLYANILRDAVQDQIVIHRDELALLMGDPTPKHASNGSTNNFTPEQFAAYDQDAAVGERLDPDNAYFPFMRAAGLFAAHRDDAAIAAILRAGQKPVWAEYYNDEVKGEWQLQEATLGHISALPKAVLAFSINFPQYRALRAASRMAVFKAAEAEQAGRIEEGLAIRQAVQHCAGLMRIQSQSVLGAFIGVSLLYDSLLRPGGVLTRRSGSSAQAVQKVIRNQRIRDFEDYLQRIGHSAEVTGLQTEISAGEQARQIIRLSMDRNPLGTMALIILCAKWAVQLLIVFNALWILLLGGAAAILKQHPRIRSGQGLAPDVRRGFAVGALAAGIPAAAAALHNTPPHPGVYLVWALLGGALALSLPGLAWSAKLRSLGVFAATFVVLGGLGAVYFQQTTGMLGALMPVIQLIQVSISSAKAPPDLTPSLLPLLLVSGVVVPLLLLLTLGLLSLKWRVPLAVGLSRGLQGSAVPIACVLVLVYAVLVPITVRQESIGEEALQHWAIHEGRYFAESIGKTWPDATH